MRLARELGEVSSARGEAAQRASASAFRTGLTIIELIAAYWQFAEGYYVKNGRPTDQRGAQGPRNPLPVVADDKARTYINGVCAAVRRVFRWGVSQELIPVQVHQALATVSGLKQGRTSARETPPVLPVSNETLAATLPHLPPVIVDMVQLQRLMGCRPGEICQLRPADVDVTGPVWVYKPASHKGQHHGRERLIFIGPKAQAILRPYLERPAETYCFSPAEATSLSDRPCRTHVDGQAHRPCHNWSP